MVSDKAIKVLYIINEVTDGVGRYLATVVPRLPTYNIEPIVLNLKGVYMSSAVDALKNIECHDLNAKHTASRWLRTLGLPCFPYQRKVYDLIKTINPALIHSHYYHTSVFVQNIATKTNIPHIVHVHGTPPVFIKPEIAFRFRLIARKYSNVLNSPNSYVMLVGQHIQPILEKHGVSPHWIQALPNGIDCQEFNPSNRSEQIDSIAWENLAKPRIVFVGRIDANKDVATLVRAASILQQKKHRFSLLVVGTGSDQSTLETLAQEKLQPETYLFAGRQTHIPDLLGQCDIFCLPSHSEGHSLAVLEAMSMGLAAVVSDIPAMKGVVVSGTNGVLAEAGNPDSFAQAIEGLLENDEKRKQLGQAGQKLVRENYSIDMHVQALVKHYQNIIATARQT